ncbi:MAG: hypothetical protein K8R34_16945 [Methanosarcinales archaeon]|nr:hypothetical protein [Methanosarcinales archaeon]
MYPYLKTEDEEEEFNDILEIAWLLFSKRKAKRETAEKELLKLGVKSIRPLVCTIELALRDHDTSDWEIDEQSDDVSELILSPILKILHQTEAATYSLTNGHKK